MSHSTPIPELDLVARWWGEQLKAPDEVRERFTKELRKRLKVEGTNWCLELQTNHEFTSKEIYLAMRATKHEGSFVPRTRSRVRPKEVLVQAGDADRCDNLWPKEPLL